MTVQLRIWMAVGVATGLLAQVIFAQQSARQAFDPFPNPSAPRYHFDLARNFFRTPDEESTARSMLTSRLEEFQKLSKAFPGSGPELLRALKIQDSLDLEVNRHAAYLELRYYSDIRNTAALQAENALRSIANQAFRTFDNALVSHSASWFARIDKVEPGLRRYRFAIENARRAAAHRLTPEGELALAALGPMARGGGAQLFLSTVSGTDFGFVQTASGPLSVARDYSAIASNPDRRVRREGYLRNQEGLAQLRDVHADILFRTATALNSAARLRRYANYAEESYGGRFLDRAQVLSFLNRLSARGETNKQIERAIIDHYRKAFNLDTVHVWDLTAPEPNTDVPRFTIAEATRLVLEATRPLGESYTRELEHLLDPANGRLDIAPGPNRANRQGFSTGLVGFPSMFYQGEFGGYVDDLITLAHESGHAVQNMLMTSAQVLPRYASGPAYFTESFAGLSELLVLDHLYRTAPDRAHQIFYLQRLINQGAEVFRNGWESLVEQQLFDRAAAGRQFNADDIEAITQATASRVSVWFGEGSERRLAWLQPTQFFTRPLYRVNYVYAKLLALRYFDLLHKKPGKFTVRYRELLSNGYDAPPDELLRRSVDIRLADPALIDSATRVLESWLTQLEALYRSDG
ncbi:MAG TPA: M3 family metallopeptidase [Blastocatellia bacterium]|nr:M3 family metallopeptidase [Blastocatellia bacterium]